MAKAPGATTPAEMQRALAEEIADDAADLFAWVSQRGTREDGLGDQFDLILGRLREKVNMLHACRHVLKRRESDRLDSGRPSE